MLARGLHLAIAKLVVLEAMKKEGEKLRKTDEYKGSNLNYVYSY